jgi:hypothetical protein
VSTRIRLAELVAEYMADGREAFAEKYAGVAALRGVGKVVGITEEEEFEGRTMMVAVGGDNPYENDQMSPLIETEEGSCTDLLWLIPSTSRVMSLGRNATAYISIPEYSVSADHGLLQWKEGAGLGISDSAASNGIWIEREDIERLQDGEIYVFEGEERIILGRFVFSFHYFDALMMQVGHLAAIKNEIRKQSKKSRASRGSKASGGGFFKRFFGG